MYECVKVEKRTDKKKNI